MPNPKQQPYILIDFTKHRIRITKYALHLMGDPKYVRLLINPETRTIGVEECDHTEPLRHRIPSYIMKSKQCYEIYSTSLFEQLRLHTNWEPMNAYKIYASAQVDGKLLLFRFDDSFRSVAGMPVLDDDEEREAQDEQVDS